MTERTAPPPLDELLARREWVRRFARTLARDDASADDLAQEAWLAAIEHPPAHADAPAGWFRRVILRRAMNRSRGDRRREARENAASRPGSSPPTADVVAAAESHRRVVEAVMALDEPYRTTILLRFFEDLPPREVAARMDVPVETVRARVRRAVEKLRARLDDEHEGNRAVWLAPLLAPGRGESAPVPIGAAATGAIAMTATQKTVLAVAVVLALGAGVSIVGTFSRRDADVAVPPPRETSDATPHRPRVHAHERTDASATTPEVAAAAAAPAATAQKREFVAHVVDAGHKPIPHIRVHVDDAGRGGDAVTDDDGRATFQVTGDVRTVSADHEAADGHAWRQKGGASVIAPGAAEIELVVERWEPVRGRVVDERGVALRSAEVLVIVGGQVVADVVTDDGGKFSVAVPPGAACDVALSGKIDRAPQDARVPELIAEARGVAPGGDEVKLVARELAGTKTMRIRTVTSDGRAVSDVRVSVTTPTTWREVGSGRTDLDGRLTVADLPDRPLRVVVAWADYGKIEPWEAAGWIAPPWPVWHPAVVRPGDAEVTLVFQAGRPIRGRVELPDSFPTFGTAVPSALVSVSDGNETLSRSWSGPDRRFTVWVPVAARGPFRISTGLGATNGGSFDGEVKDVLPDTQDVVLKVAATKR